MSGDDDPRQCTGPEAVQSYLDFAFTLVDEVRSLLDGGEASDTRRKGDGSLVTALDERIERTLRDRIAAAYPGHGVLGEEYGATRPDNDLRWVIDPIDGTEDFVRGIPTYGTLIALEKGGWPLVSIIDHPALAVCSYAAYGQGAFRNEMRLRLDSGAAEPGPVVLPAFANFAGDRSYVEGLRALIEAFPNYRVFRNCFGHSLAISGAADGAVEFNVHWWDLAATRLIIEEAGGVFASWRLDDAQPGLHAAVFGKALTVKALSKILQRL